MLSPQILCRKEFKEGAGNRIRTDDLLITNLVVSLSTLVIICHLPSIKTAHKPLMNSAVNPIAS